MNSIWIVADYSVLLICVILKIYIFVIINSQLKECCDVCFILCINIMTSVVMTSSKIFLVKLMLCDAFLRWGSIVAFVSIVSIWHVTSYGLVIHCDGSLGSCVGLWVGCAYRAADCAQWYNHRQGRPGSCGGRWICPVYIPGSGWPGPGKTQGENWAQVGVYASPCIMGLVISSW